MDFGERLARKITADVERQIEASLTGGTHVGEGRKTGTALTGLALVGLVGLVLLVAAVVAIVLLLLALL